jgi:putative transposase
LNGRLDECGISAHSIYVNSLILTPRAQPGLDRAASEVLESPATVPQSLSKVYIHLVFSTKYRMPSLPDEIRPELHPYLGGILKGLGCTPIEINTEPDHAHVLFLLSRTEALSEIVGHLKKSSNDWLRKQGPQFAQFFWQGGYGAFSVSRSQLEHVQAYIRNQHEHHRGKSFQDEFRALLKAYEVEYDERYVWD